MVRKSLMVAALGLVALASGQANASLTPAYSAVPSTTINPGSTQSLGFQFTVVNAIVVQTLGVYQATNASPVVNQAVELIDVSKGSSVVASTTVSSNGVSNGFSYSAVANTTLIVGDTYQVVSLFPASTTQYTISNSSFAPSSDINLTPINGSGYTGFSQGATIQPLGSGYFQNILATNFQYSAAGGPVVPEPASFAMVALGLTSIVIFRRKSAKVAA